MIEENVNKDFYSVIEFSKRLGIHPNTVRRSIEKGRIQAINFGTENKKLYRIPKSEIERIALVNMEDIIEKIIEKRSSKNELQN